MTGRSSVGLTPWVIAAASLVGATLARSADETGADRLMASSVCVLGEVPDGKFEASGFVVEPGSYVITTAHGIAPAKNLRIKTSDGRVFPARMERIGNERADIALLEIVGARLDPAPLGSVEGLRPGDPVRTIGCPSGFEFSLTQGVVSSVRPSDFGYPLIQTDVPVNPGSSGGALFDDEGTVVGIIKAGAADRQRINFALPIDLARALLDEVRNERRAYELFNQAVLEPLPAEKIRLYGEVVRIRPDLVEGHHNLAVALERAGRSEEAEREYRKALELEPSYGPAALNLGAALHERGSYGAAVEVYRRALEGAPETIRLRNNLAEAYRALGEYEKARREFQAILARRPDYAPAHYGLAVLYDDELENPERAAIHYRRYLALAPDASDAGRVREWLRHAEEKR